MAFSDKALAAIKRGTKPSEEAPAAPVEAVVPSSPPTPNVGSGVVPVDAPVKTKSFLEEREAEGISALNAKALEWVANRKKSVEAPASTTESGPTGGINFSDINASLKGEYSKQKELDVTMTTKGLQQLIMDESSGKDHLKSYKDSVGVPTIGHGFNLQDKSNARLFEQVTGLSAQDAIDGRVSITRDQQMELLRHTVTLAETDARDLFPSFTKFKPDVQDALVNFVFNLGKTRAAEFRNTIAAFERGDAAAAARGLRNSKWAKQVGPRADRIIATVEAGLFPEKPKADKSIKVNVNG